MALLDLHDCQFSQFKLADEKLFERFSEVATGDVDTEYNYCPDCRVPMTLSGSEYHCDHCGQVKHNAEGSKDHDETVSGAIRISTGANKGRFYNGFNEYTKTQRKAILGQLLQNQTGFASNAFPLNVLNAAATQYNNIQKFITEDDIDENGKVIGQKKFVRRSNIKDEVLAGLIYFECIRANIVRKKKDIASFMKLPTNGFARGEDVLRNLHAEGKIDIPCDGEEPIEGYIDRYLEELNLDNPNYSGFITEVVKESERRKIGMNSQLSSKVVACVWIVISKCNLKVTSAQVEKACDNTKKNTFMKFYRVIFDNIYTFAPIFKKYNIEWR